jgi:hypothetical protein
MATVLGVPKKAVADTRVTMRPVTWRKRPRR